MSINEEEYKKQILFEKKKELKTLWTELKRIQSSEKMKGVWTTKIELETTQE